MKSHLIAFTLALILLSPLTAFGAFSDVSNNHIHADAVTYVQAEGIVGGYPDGTYQPDNGINRAEFTKIVVGAVDINTETLCRIGAFSDTPGDQWYYNFVIAARCNGLIDGYPDGSFKPSAGINFVEAAKIIVEAFDYTVIQGDTWFEGYVRVLEDHNAIPLQIAGFESTVTRGQMAEMIYRLHAEVDTKPSRTYAEMSGGSGTGDDFSDFEDDLDGFDEYGFDDWEDGDEFTF